MLPTPRSVAAIAIGRLDPARVTARRSGWILMRDGLLFLPRLLPRPTSTSDILRTEPSKGRVAAEGSQSHRVARLGSQYYSYQWYVNVSSVRLPLYLSSFFSFPFPLFFPFPFKHVRTRTCSWKHATGNHPSIVITRENT